jgi:hypothetical protein
MEKFQQPEGMKKYLEDLLMKDAYNKYCVDCNDRDSTYANITYGTFICDQCAKWHTSELGQHKSYIKPIYSDLWDEY